MRASMKKLYFISLLFCLNSCGSQVPDSELTAYEQSDDEQVRLKNCYKGDPWTCEIEAEIVKLTNRLRNRKPLEQNFATSFVARTWSADQAKAEALSHDGFPQRREKVLELEFPGYKVLFRAE